MARKIEVQIVGDASSLSKAFKQASKQSTSFGSALGKTAKYAALAAGAAGIGGLAVVLKSGIQEFSEASKVAAQTNAVLKSTGGVANVTAKQVDALSQSLMNKSGVDDEQIKTGQNMLLTFTKIRNEAGKGNDIFNQATKATLDLSVAMGKDMQSSAVLVGKALNDPIKGMTALSRAGVQLSADQVKLIKGFVATGDVMSAQKVLLGELNTQFGGSAEALGNTLPGQVNKLKESFNNLSGQVVASLVPSFTKILDWTNQHWPQIEKTIKQVFTVISQTIGAFVSFIRTHWQTITTVTTTAFNTVRSVAEAVWPRVQEAAARVVAWYRGTLQPAIQNVIAAVTAIWNRFGGDITRIASTAFNTARAVIQNALNIIRGVVEGVLALIRGDWQKAWDSLKLIVRSALSGIGALIRGFASIAFRAAVAIGAALIDGILSGVSSLGERLRDSVTSKIQGAISGIKGAFDIRSPSGVTAREIGAPLGEGVVMGWLVGSAPLPDKMKESVRKAIEAGRQAIEASRGVFTAAWGGVAGDVLSAFDAIQGQLQTKSEKLLSNLQAQRAAASRAEAVSTAQAALAAALGGTDGTVDPEAVRAAQKQLDDALWAQREFGLQQRAEQERREMNARIAQRRRDLENAVASLGERMQKEGATAAEATRSLLKLLGRFGVDFKKVGASMGQAWIEGLKETIEAAAKGAGVLSGTIAKAAAGVSVPGRAAGGPVAAGGAYMVGERGPELFLPRRSGMVVPNHALGGGGDIVIQVDGETLARVNRRYAEKHARRNGGTI